MAKELFFPGGFGWLFRKGSPARRKVDVIISRLVEAGLVEKWLTDLIENTKSDTPAEEDSDDAKALEVEVKKEEGPQPFSLYHLQGLFMVYLGGVFLALVIFLIELVYSLKR